MHYEDKINFIALIQFGIVSNLLPYIKDHYIFIVSYLNKTKLNKTKLYGF
jgi:hypothetical protein